MAPQPDCVTGPRHGVPPATITQVVPRALHSKQTLVEGSLGGRPFRSARTVSTSCSLEMGQPRSSRSTFT